jgi:hypothetical protein
MPANTGNAAAHKAKVGVVIATSDLTPFERAQIRLAAFHLLAGWGFNTGDPKAENLLDRYVHTPWNLEQRMQRADELAEWAMDVDAAVKDIPDAAAE